MRILYVTTIGSTMSFFTKFIETLINMGHTVDLACNESQSPVRKIFRDMGCTVYPIQTSRSPLDRGNLAAIGEIKELVRKNRYDIVHCHTPIAAACTRLACREARKRGTKVFYTAHGFHFYKGAPVKNWLLYYPVEKLCAHFTDVLITINHEDYALAQWKMKAKKVVYVPGVGIDLEKFGRQPMDRAAKRKELGVPEDATLLLSVGELIPRKNHETTIRAIADIKDVWYIIAGQGEMREHLQDVIRECGATDRVKLLGYRKDVGELCDVADAFVLPSFQEGLPVAVMEAMASGLPVACSRIRGNTDLIDENGGVLFDPHSVEDCREAVKTVLASDRAALGAYNAEKIKNFSLDSVIEQMKEQMFGGGCCHLEALTARQRKRKELEIPQGAILLLSVGELDQRKNHQVILRAMAELHNPDIFFAVAGEGGQRTALEQLAEELDLTRNIRLLGYRSDVRELYEAADIFCFPSRREGLGMGAIEAMACGLPLITSNIQGINDYSENGVTGYKCSPEDVKGFADAIKRLSGDCMLRHRIGGHNRMLAMRYDVKGIIEKMEGIYAEEAK